jgi:hypothetical protein
MSSLSQELISKVDNIKEKITNQEYLELCNIIHNIHKSLVNMNNNNRVKRVIVNFHFIDGKIWHTTIINNFTVNYLWILLKSRNYNEHNSTILYNDSIVRNDYQTIYEKFGDIDEINLYAKFL